MLIKLKLADRDNYTKMNKVERGSERIKGMIASGGKKTSDAPFS